LGTGAAFDTERLAAFQGSFSGELLREGDAGYDEARQVHNALIARGRTAADVAAAIRFARDAGLDISVKGGGHNVAGRAVANDAVMIDLSLMKEISVDAAERTARAGGGTVWNELNAATAVHGLAVTGGAISSTGVAGLTLGGGLGWLMSTQGLAADNLIGVELVTAAGEIVNVTSASHPDLFWALQGGGGNFGVATALEFRLHAVEMITGGLIAHPFEAAGNMFRFYRDALANASDDLTVFAGVVHAPDGSGMKLAAMIVFHTGSPEQAEIDLAPFKEWGPPIMVEVGPMPYAVMNTILDAAYPTGALNYWLSSFTSGMPDGLIDTVVEQFGSVPSPMTAILFEQFHGAVTRVGVTDTAVPHRETGWNMLIPSVWLDPADTATNIAWTKEAFAAIRPHLSGKRWLNYLGDDQADDAIRAAYGPNYDRLAEIKRRYDPDNVFHHNHNIPPAA
jgi:FAD/FMN-containing dehydrogenase